MVGELEKNKIVNARAPTASSAVAPGGAADLAIQARNVGRTFRTTAGEEVVALERVDLDVAEREFVAVLGPSGCGKSTLMQIMAGLSAPTTGEVKVRGTRVTGPRRDVGVVFQQPALFPWRSVLQNVQLSGEVLGLERTSTEARAHELLALVGLAESGRLYPYELSGGMQQRVSIARALLHDPAILFMDEPFGALDAMTRENMGLELLRIWDAKRKTVVFITHSVNEAVFLADRVLMMGSRPGRVVEDFRVPLPRPRNLEMMAEPEFGRSAQHLRRLLGAKLGD